MSGVSPVFSSAFSSCSLFRQRPRPSAVVLTAALLSHAGTALAAPPAALPRQAAQVPQKVELVPHRAVYDLALDETRAGSSVGGVAGRLVLEFTGSPCHGYTLNTRLVTRLTDKKGNLTLSDLRSSTFEDGRGQSFRFATTQYLGGKLAELTFGRANRRAGADGRGIDIHLKRPHDMAMRMSADVLFPTQHSRAILKAARAGKRLLEAHIYDGSDRGDKVYLTATYIGAPQAPRAQPVSTHSKPARATSMQQMRSGTDMGELDRLPSWPVIISYYDQDMASDKAGEGVPSYELAYTLYANGVSRNLLINYGDFSMNGVLSDLKLLPAPACP